ncbi:MAG: nucleotide pyrophosphohydrolase [Erysipelotrichaceae bacterium]|nr:nucleotide pyrophosphohydrolase [Erysipelotrichaceae bacterium]
MDRFEQIKQRIDKFVTDRDWRQFHTPSNLAKSISIEASELLECFQWSDTDYDLEHVKEELADVLNYCIQMSQVLNLDIVDILNAKMDKTEKKYPLEKSKGVSTKYDKLK